MYLALVLILSGVFLAIFGAKAFFAVIFIGIGVFVLLSLVKISSVKKRRRDEILDTVRRRLGNKIDEEDLKWIADLVDEPVGRKLFILVSEQSTNVKIVIPVSVILLLKPAMKLIVPLIVRTIDKKMKTNSEEYAQIIEAIIGTSLDELLSYTGDFVRVESQGTTVRIGIA